MKKTNEIQILIHGGPAFSETMTSEIQRLATAGNIQISMENGDIYSMEHCIYDLYFFDADSDKDWQETIRMIPLPQRRAVPVSDDPGEYADAFQYGCYDFLCRRRFPDDLARILRRCICEKDESLQISRNISLPFRSVKAIEAVRNNVEITAGTTVYSKRCTLKQMILEKDLLRYFVRINRSQLVNPVFVKGISGNAVQMKDGSIYYISRRFRHSAAECVCSFVDKQKNGS